MTGRRDNLTDRDAWLLETIRQVEFMTAKQIATLAFSSYPAAKRRMTKLHRLGVVGRLARRFVCEPWVYVPKRKRAKAGLLDHQLGVTEVFVRVARACRALGWAFVAVPTSGESMTAIRQQTQLMPDAYWRIDRPVGDGLRRGGLFLEYEHTDREAWVLKSKLLRYSKLFYSDLPRTVLGARGMRVLLVYRNPAKVATGVAIAEALGVTLAFFTSLERVEQVDPRELLTAPIWRQAHDNGTPLALWEKEP